jgi:hypothetical protein
MDQPQESTQNENAFYTLLKRVRPDVFVLIDLIDINRINTYVVLKILYQLLKIATHNGYGKVNIFMEDGKVTKVDGIDSSFVNEKMILEEP